MNPERITIGFWLLWLLTFVSFPIGGSIAYGLVRSVDDPLDGAIGGAVAGAALGLAQWLVLRRAIDLGPWWIAATSLGLALGLSLGVALLGIETGWRDLLVRGAIAGLAVGVAQWLLLRQHSQAAVWWAPTVLTSWALGWAVTRAAGVDLSFGWAVFGSTGALAFAALTGVALALILRA